MTEDGLTSRRSFLKKAGGILLGTGCAGLAAHQYGTQIETEWLEIVKVTIPVTGLETALEGFKVVHLSDFHLYPHTRLDYIRTVVDEANDLKPDLTVLTGDFVLRRVDSILDLAPVLARLDARQGVFAVLGNHDIWKGADLIRTTLEKVGIPVLHNRGLTLMHQKTRLFLAGVDDCWSGQPDLSRALAEAPSQVPVILLAHEPDFADLFCRDQRVTVQLSGHSHGGQVRFPFFGSPFLPPYGKKYDLGLYRVQETWLYTNRGVGVTAPIRLNCRPELTQLVLSA
jgi:predicted MPP superfamily phosphohydrolase